MTIRWVGPQGHLSRENLEYQYGQTYTFPREVALACLATPAYWESADVDAEGEDDGKRT